MALRTTAVYGSKISGVWNEEKRNANLFLVLELGRLDFVEFLL